MEEVLRKCFPTSYELTCRTTLNRKKLNVNLGFKEFSFIKMFSDDEINSKEFDKNILKKDFKDFCKDKNNKSLIGIFYPQFTDVKKLSDDDLKVIDEIQDIKDTNIRLIHFKDNISFEEFKERNSDFIIKNPNKRLIPVLNINVKNKSDLILLGQKAEYVRNNFKECIVNYCNWKNYSKAWKVVSSMLEGLNWYVFKLPTTECGGFSLIVFCFLIGANATCHKLYRGGGNGTPNSPLFLNLDMSLRTIASCDNGLAKYGTKDRINFLIEDKRKSYVRLFAKWDRIVQANMFCVVNKKLSDLQNLKSIEHAHKYFSQ